LRDCRGREREFYAPEGKIHPKERFRHAIFRDNQAPDLKDYALEREKEAPEREPDGREGNNHDNLRENHAPDTEIHLNVV